MLPIRWAIFETKILTSCLLKIGKKRYFDWQIKKCNFLRIFLKTRYLNKNLKFSLLFPTRYDRSDSNSFYKYFNRIGVQIFSWKCCSCKILAGVKKLVALKKTRFLIVFSALSFSQSSGIGNNIFQTKITRTRDLFLVIRKKFQPWKMKNEYSRGERGAQIIFSPCDSHISLKGASGKLELDTNFAPNIKIYLPKKFHKFSLNCSRETP